MGPHNRHGCERQDISVVSLLIILRSLVNRTVNYWYNQEKEWDKGSSDRKEYNRQGLKALRNKKLHHYGHITIKKSFFSPGICVMRFFTHALGCSSNLATTRDIIHFVTALCKLSQHF